MGQGQDRIASSLLELQPTAIIELFLLYFNTVDKPNAFIAFHGGSVYNKGIVWQGIEYLPIPVETDSFEVTANGQLSRPKMRISNKNYFATDLLINNDDLQFAKIIRKRTFVKYLDEVNFDGGNPWGEADSSAELSNDTFVVGQKTAENKIYVELELTSPLDLENFEVNNRLIMSRYCSWYYRGNGCNYNGIPVATETNERLIVADPSDWLVNQAQKKWLEGRSYVVGDAVYIENQKIIINNPDNTSPSEFAKIWYVCQSAHTSSSATIPDKNTSLWKRDGCNKKLDGCQLRFGKGRLEFNTTSQSRTAHLVDFTSRAGTLRYNNIAPHAIVAASSSTVDLPANKTVDLLTGSTSLWRAGGSAKTGLIQLEWPIERYINRIDLYDDPSTSYNFQNAYITMFRDDEAIRSGNLTVPTNGTRATTGFDATYLTKITISGTATTIPSLSEVAVFETPTYLTYNDEETIPLHKNNFFQIATWVELNGRNANSTEIYSVFHNILGNCRFSGINLYISGTNLHLDFATRLNNVTQNKRLSVPWRNDDLKPIHLICSGGSSTSTDGGYIQLIAGTEIGTLNLSKSPQEYFLFKLDDFQQGINSDPYRLKFAINDWQFPIENEFIPSTQGPANQIISNMKLISPIKFGPTIFWSGGSGIDVRMEDFNLSVHKDYIDFQIKQSNTKDLIGWWEMDANEGGLIFAKNNVNKELVIVASEPYIYRSSSSTNISTTDLVNLQKQNIDLPFGGFPGTEKYG